MDTGRKNTMKKRLLTQGRPHLSFTPDESLKILAWHEALESTDSRLACPTITSHVEAFASLLKRCMICNVRFTRSRKARTDMHKNSGKTCSALCRGLLTQFLRKAAPGTEEFEILVAAYFLRKITNLRMHNYETQTHGRSYSKAAMKESLSIATEMSSLERKSVICSNNTKPRHRWRGQVTASEPKENRVLSLTLRFEEFLKNERRNLL
jgi:hypothetical protein